MQIIKKFKIFGHKMFLQTKVNFFSTPLLLRNVITTSKKAELNLSNKITERI